MKKQPDKFQFEILYDGDCPLCKREIAFLRRKDHKNRILFTDLQSLDFARTHLNKTYSELMAEIHGRLPDGTWVRGVEVFRRVYAAIGWTWVVAFTRWPIVRHLLDLSYRIFARHRLRLTGRCQSSCEVKVPQ